MRRWVGPLRQTVPAVKICSPSLLAWSVSPKMTQEGFSESAATLISSLPQVSPPNQTQPRLASAWMSFIRLAARRASQTPFSKPHYGFALWRSMSSYDFAFAGHCTHFCGHRPKMHTHLIHWHMLARNPMQTLETHTPKQQQKDLIDISTATVDPIFAACWRGTAMENAANQPVSQSGYLPLLGRR